MKPNPKDYKSITSYRLAQAEQAEAKAFARKLRRFLILAFLTILVMLGLINWPGATLAVILVVGCIAALWAGRQLRWEAKEYDEEHDL